MLLLYAIRVRHPSYQTAPTTANVTKLRERAGHASTGSRCMLKRPRLRVPVQVPGRRSCGRHTLIGTLGFKSQIRKENLGLLATYPTGGQPAGGPAQNLPDAVLTYNSKPSGKPKKHRQTTLFSWPPFNSPARQQNGAANNGHIGTDRNLPTKLPY